MFPQLTCWNIVQEDPRSTLYFAHLFFADHILSTSWTIFFAVVWWLYSPHDGRRVSNSAAQDNIIENYLGETEKVSEEERARLALQLWRKEKGVAIAIIVLGWLIKVGRECRLTTSLFDFPPIVLSCGYDLLLRDSLEEGKLSQSPPLPSKLCLGVHGDANDR
jgi:hypothetical protein